ncbi:MAG: ferrous iron transport protein A [Bacilli bacterium]|nr:ferrous iron transport protein A [Bacilli bacterium]
MSKIITLDKLKINEIAKVISIDSKCELKRRLEDLGIIKGSTIKCEFTSPFKDPTAYLIKGCTIAIRNDTSKYIKVKKI